MRAVRANRKYEGPVAGAARLDSHTHEQALPAAARAGLYAILIGILLLLAAPRARADVYQWTSPSGSVVFSDDASAFAAARPAQEREVSKRSLQTVAAALPRESSREVRVPFQFSGNLIHVTARLNGRVDAPFIVDTGTSHLMIPLRVAEQLGFCKKCKNESTRVAGVGGMTEMPVMWIEVLSLGSAQVQRVQAVVNENIQFGLLGGGFLNHFIYTVDLDANELQLRRRAAKP
jgi:predicted aspartyl protease